MRVEILPVFMFRSPRDTNTHDLQNPKLLNSPTREMTRSRSTQQTQGIWHVLGVQFNRSPQQTHTSDSPSKQSCNDTNLMRKESVATTPWFQYFNSSAHTGTSEHARRGHFNCQVEINGRFGLAYSFTFGIISLYVWFAATYDVEKEEEREKYRII